MVTGFVKRLVLKPHVTESDFELAAWGRNWLIREMDEEDAGALVDTWVSSDGTTEIHYVEDRSIGLNYLTLHGEATTLIEQQIREDLDLWSLPEALDALRAAEMSDDKRPALYAVALTAPPAPHDEVIDEFRDVAIDADPVVRRSFVEAVGYLPWPQLVELVEALRRDDPDPLVRDDARLLLEGMRLHGKE